MTGYLIINAWRRSRRAWASSDEKVIKVWCHNRLNVHTNFCVSYLCFNCCAERIIDNIEIIDDELKRNQLHIDKHALSFHINRILNQNRDIYSEIHNYFRHWITLLRDKYFKIWPYCRGQSSRAWASSIVKVWCYDYGCVAVVLALMWRALPWQFSIPIGRSL